LLGDVAVCRDLGFLGQTLSGSWCALGASFPVPRRITAHISQVLIHWHLPALRFGIFTRRRFLNFPSHFSSAEWLARY